jgi:hypothetical protein
MPPLPESAILGFKSLTYKLSGYILYPNYHSVS